MIASTGNSTNSTVRVVNSSSWALLRSVVDQVIASKTDTLAKSNVVELILETLIMTDSESAVVDCVSGTLLASTRYAVVAR